MTQMNAKENLKIPAISLSIIPGIAIWNYGHGLSYIQLIYFLVLLLLFCFAIGKILVCCCRWLPRKIDFDLWLYDEKQYRIEDYFTTLLVLFLVGIATIYICPSLKIMILRLF